MNNVVNIQKIREDKIVTVQAIIDKAQIAMMHLLRLQSLSEHYFDEELPMYQLKEMERQINYLFELAVKEKTKLE